MSTSNTITKADLENIINAIFPATTEDMTQAQIDAFVNELQIRGSWRTTWKDISSSFTVNTSYVMSLNAYTDEHTVYVFMTTKGAPDQTNVVTNIATKYRPPSYVPMSVFYMNGEDFDRKSNATIQTSTIQVRCNTASTGVSGIKWAGSYPLI